LKTRAPVTTPQGHEVSSTNQEVGEFLAKAKSLPLRQGEDRGRLVFAMDATMSRQPTWDQALAIQGQMFEETAKIGGLDVQLVYFRGFNECMASRWVSDPKGLAKLMSGIACRGGHTQIRKVLQHIKLETERARVQAAVYVGDAMEEDVDLLCARAGEIGLLGVPIFMFQEGYDARAESAFREIARLTKGAYCRFDLNAAGQLRALLAAVAVYAAGGRQALEHYGRKNRPATLLLDQLR